MSWIRFTSEDFRVETLRSKIRFFESASAGALRWNGSNCPEAVGWFMAARELGSWLSVGPADSVAFPGAGGLVLATSGATGRSKCCRLSFEMIDANAKWAVQLVGLSESSHVIVSSSLMHTSGWNTLLIPALSVGANITMLERFDPYAVVSLMNTDRAGQVFHFSPMQADLIQRTKTWKTLRPGSGTRVVIGSSDVYPRLIRNFCSKGITVIRNYGLTEAGPYVFSKRTLPTEVEFQDLKTLGDLAPSFEYRVVSFSDSNLYKLYLRGAAVFEGYDRDLLGREWLETGDLVSQVNGEIVFQCRAADLLNSEKGLIVPNAVEREILHRHTDAWEVALFRGSSLAASPLVVAVVGISDEVELRRIRTSASDLLEISQRDVEIVNVRKLPRTFSGKIDRNQPDLSPYGF